MLFDKNKKNDGKEERDFLKKLLKIVKVAVSLICTFTGVSVISIIIIIKNVIEESNSHSIPGWVVVISVVIVLFLSIALSICCFVIFKIKKENHDFYKEQVEKLESVVGQAVVGSYVLNSKQIEEIERNTGCNQRIVVMASKFKLDKKFMPIILDNIRKGAKYEYLVPQICQNNLGDECSHENFKRIYNSWWRQFIEEAKKDINSMGRSRNDIYCGEYFYLIRKCRENRKNYVNELKQYFEKHIIERSIDCEHSMHTIILYQQKACEPCWTIVMSLPSVSNEDYYAFLVPDFKPEEKTALAQVILNFCNNRIVPLELDEI